MELVDSKTEQLTQDTLAELMETTASPCVSIYMPTERQGPEIQQSPIRLRNLLDEAEEQLFDLDWGPAEVQALLQPVRDLVETETFWRHQSDGLALFLTPDRLDYFRLPLTLPEQVFVGERYHTKPLIPLLSGDGHFFILTLKQNGVHLWQATRYSLGEVALPVDTPASLSEELQYDVYQEQLQFHTGTGRVSQGERGAMFFGQGDAGDEAQVKEQLLTFMRHLDNGVRAAIQEGRQTPLVLAGVGYLQGLYRQVNQYRWLVEPGIDQDPATLSQEQLHEQAWALVQPQFDGARANDLERYRQLAGNGDARVSDAVHEVVPAAYFQRVDTLFLAENAVYWGVFSPDKNRIVAQAPAQRGAEDLLDLAALHTWRNGGAVYVLPAAEMPTTNPAAAIFRY